MPMIPLTRVELSPTGEGEEHAFSNQLTGMLNDALAWPSFLSPSLCLQLHKTITLSCRDGKPVVRIAASGTVFAEQTGQEPLLKLISQTVEKRFAQFDP